MVSADDYGGDCYSAQYAQRFVRAGAAGQIVDFYALDRWLAEVADELIAARLRELAADYRDRAEHISADAGPGSFDAAVFAELADELDDRAGGAR
jgi:hypothetical protein